MGRKPAGGHGRKRVADGIEHRHIGEDQQEYLENGQQHINKPEGLGGMGNARGNFILAGAWRLGKKDLPAGDTELRQDSDKQNDDPHAAQPLRQGPPEKKRPWIQGEIGEDRCPGGGKAGDRFKIGIDWVQAEKQVGQGADSCGNDPG